MSQLVLSLAISLGITAGFNPDVRARVQHLVLSARDAVVHETDLAAQSTFGAQTRTSAVVNAGGSPDSQNHSDQINGNANFSANSNHSSGIQNETNANANACTQTSVNSTSFLSLFLNGCSSLTTGAGLGQ